MAAGIRQTAQQLVDAAVRDDQMARLAAQSPGVFSEAPAVLVGARRLSCWGAATFGWPDGQLAGDRSEHSAPFRYSLLRIWDPGLPSVLFIGMNPSTADARTNDPTIRRCLWFAAGWGYGSLVMCNLFAYRATDPAAMASWWLRGQDIVGPEHDLLLAHLARESGDIVVAWGSISQHPRVFRPAVRARVDAVAQLLNVHGSGPRSIVCLGTTADRQPRHPLYLAGDAERRPWVP
jgi:hypothetical protein